MTYPWKMIIISLPAGNSCLNSLSMGHNDAFVLRNYHTYWCHLCSCLVYVPISRREFQQTSWYSGIYIFLCHLSWCFLSHSCRSCADAFVGAGISMIPWNCMQLWFSDVVSICPKEKLLWKWVRAILNYCHKDKI